MELILINQTKLKIMLSAPDMLHYELDTQRLEGMACTDRQTRAAFRHIFDDAEAQTGFHTSGERLLVQMYTSKCGGCEIFVTKLGALCAVENEAPSPDAFEGEALTANENALIQHALSCDEPLDEGPLIEEGVPMSSLSDHERKDTLQPSQTALRKIILTVAEMNTLLAVCRRLYTLGYHNDSIAYIEKDRTPPAYHLHLEVPDGIFYLLPEEFAFLKEYGEVSCHRHLQLYLSEHGEVLCAHNAVATLGRL